MEKLSNAKVAQVLRDTKSVLLTVTAERDKLAAENASLKCHNECAKLASVMHAKGLELDMEFNDLVTHLEKEAGEGNLSEISRAVGMIGPNMSFGSAASSYDNGEGGGGDSLTSFILGNVG
jgi:hypothetical protein